MGRTSLIVVAALALLAACGGQKAAQDPPRTHSPTVSATPSPTAPVMPALAREHTKAGAKAFIAYFWDVVNDAQATLDTATLRSLANPLCVGCNGGVGAIEKIKAGDGVSTGGDVIPTVLNSRRESTSTLRLMSLVLSLHIQPMLVTYPSPRAADSYPAATEKERFVLSEQPTGWQVELIEPLK